MSAAHQWQLSGSAADLYDRYPARYILGPWAPGLVRLARLQPGERVLDLACGTGVVARLAAEAVRSTGRVAGFDLNAGMLAVARARPHPSGSPITWIRGSAVAMGVRSASFDVVLCQQGFQFFPDRAAALGEMRRVLAPRGRLLLSVWRGACPYNAAVIDALREHVGAEVAARFSMSRVVPDAGELHRLAVAAGLREVAIHASAMSIRLPPLERFVPSHLAATPVAGAVAAAGAEARAALAEHVSRALRGYADREGVAIPDEANVLTAFA